MDHKAQRIARLAELRRERAEVLAKLDQVAAGNIKMHRAVRAVYVKAAAQLGDIISQGVHRA